MLIKLFSLELFHVLAKPTQIDLGFIFGPKRNQQEAVSDAEKGIAKKLAEKMLISRNAALIGAIVYGDDAKVAWKLGDATDLKTTISKIDRLQRPSGGNNVLKSLQLARDVLFSTANGARVGYPKVLILFVTKTEGKDLKIERIAKELKDRGINLIVVASGSLVDKRDLSGVASKPSNLLVSTDLAKDNESVSLAVALKSRPGKISFLLINQFFD